MSNLDNIIMLTGNAGKEARINKTSKTTIANFSMATQSSRKQSDGSYKNFVEWHDCVAFGGTADYVQKNLKKGSKVSLRGKLEYGSYEKEVGSERVKIPTATIRVAEMTIFNKKTSSGEEE